MCSPAPELFFLPADGAAGMYRKAFRARVFARSETAQGPEPHLQRVRKKELSCTVQRKKGRCPGSAERHFFQKVFLFPLDGTQNGITYCV